MPDATELRVLRGHTGWVRTLAVSPDGKVLVSAGDDHAVRFWDIATGRTIRVLKGHDGPVRGLAFSPDGRRLATASWDRTVKLWEGGSEPAE
jgi:WD40 repeat protein